MRSYTQNVLTWLDVLALFTAAAATAVGARKGLAFLLVFPLALALYLAALGWLPPLAWPLAALIAGLLAAQTAGRIYFYVSNSWEAILGGLAGFFWGALLAVSLWTGLPAEFSVATGAYRYPSPKLPLVVQDAVAKSPFALPLFDLIQKEPILKRLLINANQPRPLPRLREESARQ